MSVAEALASPYRAQIGDREYTFHPITQSDKGLLSQWARQRGYRGVADLRSIASPEDYRDMLAAFQADVAAGRYRVGGDLLQRAASSEDGYVEIIRLMLLRHQAGITTEQVVYLVEHHNDDVMEAMAAVDPKMAIGIKQAREAAEKGEPFRAGT